MTPTVNHTRDWACVCIYRGFFLVRVRVCQSIGYCRIVPTSVLECLNDRTETTATENSRAGNELYSNV